MALLALVTLQVPCVRRRARSGAADGSDRVPAPCRVHSVPLDDLAEVLQPLGQVERLVVGLHTLGLDVAEEIQAQRVADSQEWADSQGYRGVVDDRVALAQSRTVQGEVADPSDAPQVRRVHQAAARRGVEYAVVGHSAGVVAFHVVALHVACADKGAVDTLVEAHLALVHQVVAQHQVVEVPRAVGVRGLHQEVRLQVNSVQLQVVHLLAVRLVERKLQVVHQVVRREVERLVAERLVAEHFVELVVHREVAHPVVVLLVAGRPSVERPSVERLEVGHPVVEHPAAEHLAVEHPVPNLAVERQWVEPPVVDRWAVATVPQVGCLEDRQVGCSAHDLQVVLRGAVALHHVPWERPAPCHMPHRRPPRRSSPQWRRLMGLVAQPSLKHQWQPPSHYPPASWALGRARATPPT